MSDAIPDDVRKLFDQIATKLADDGWTHYSADAVLHRVRRHYQIEKGDRLFKCNNNWTSGLARWWLERHPEHPDFFRTRALHGGAQ